MTRFAELGLVFIAIFSTLNLSISVRDDAPLYVMPWMCLEICDSKEEIQTQLGVVEQRKDLLSGVSYEKYTLGPYCELVKNESLTIISKDDLHGLDDWPMISSYPHPPEFITWFRSVIYSKACTEKFIASAIEEATKFSYTGYNLDWEPVFSEGGDGHQMPLTEKDALQYAKFIDTFALALHSNGFKLGVDVANWSSGDGAPPIWDFDAIANTSVDKVISMSTYTSNDELFAANVDALVDAFGERSGVGLMTVNATDETSALSTAEIQYRFDTIASSSVKEVDIWRMPIPDNFWDVIEEAMRSN